MQTLLTRALREHDYHAKAAAFREANPGALLRRGVGFACFMHGAGFTGSGERRLHSEVRVRIEPETLQPRILVSSTEFGQGTNTILAQVAADTLCLEYDDILIDLPDTQVVPNSGPTVASRTAMIVGKLVERACTVLLARLRSFASLPASYSSLEFQQAARAFLDAHGELSSSVQYEPVKPVHWDDDLYRGDAYPDYGWAVYVAEVEVDLLTFSVRVVRFDALQEVGKVMHPVLAMGQIEGGVAQGIGYALYEKCEYLDGRMRNNQMTNYIMPTSADLPEIHAHFAEIPSVHGPGGAKGIGELPMDGPAPAILNAIENATGVSFNSVPLLPEDLFERLHNSTSHPQGGTHDLDPTTDRDTPTEVLA